ncbi:hypothetical protein JHW45_17705 [Paracoccus stylophorae]|uniref:Maltokinase n=1 Tax=Paracoccus stylophorae TaxID=659350 RepID=A0ABY7SVB5_9RHOB|nr:hypothetical protein [Paracoccus stylophorae]WCR10839.1 hypothetical protein JHW45_17705 [Paracoccus stylophorae]
MTTPAGTDAAATAGDDLCATLNGEAGRELVRDALQAYLATRRWFGAKESRIEGVDLTCAAAMQRGRAALCVADVALAGGVQRYFLPLTAGRDAEGADIIGHLPDGAALCDGGTDMALAGDILHAMRDGALLEGDGGAVRFEGAGIPPDTETPRPLAAEQSNVSIAFGRDVILKIYRRLRAGPQPDVEISRHLTCAAGFAHAPAWLGSATLTGAGQEPTTLAAAFAFVANRGDAWSHFARRLDAAIAGDAGPADMADDAALCRLLGVRTGGLHQALAKTTDDPAFAPVAVTQDDLKSWVAEAAADVEETWRMIAQAAAGSGALADLAGDLVAARPALDAKIARVARLAPSGWRTRIHGDYHLGQVLVTEGGDLAIIDFEGEPRRDLAARRAKMAPLRDVAGMLRSLDYAARAAVLRADDPKAAAPVADAWHAAAAQGFLAGYRSEMARSDADPDAPLAAALLDLFLVQKAAYEVAYELSNRPDWAVVPMAGLLNLANAGGTS